ncbi:hypothetical protein [Hyalangium versicolor]|uniref:hypothetical protein n=1 Tax=Hyalangium versicolor TaxID=2861190 RepID=UPI001CCCBD45|nr:hypothetical protein [Hyalangium versicolor]
MNAASFLVLLSVLQQASSSGGYSTVEDVTSSQEAPAVAQESKTTFKLGFEMGPLSLPSGTPGGGQDIFAQAFPFARLDHGESFGIELGAPLRFRLIDAEPKQTADDYGGYLRHEDWDTPSDLGQLLRDLRIGRDDNVANLRAGPLQAFTLGEGHLVDRYDNQLSANYHPAGAILTVNVGPTRVQAMASDVLATRLFAGEVRLDIGRLASDQDKHYDRYHAIAAVAHDFGRVGEERTEAITAVLAGGDAALYKGEHLQFFAIGGAGTRVDAGSPNIGGFGGFSIRGNTGRVDISGRVEGRYEGGNFRFGLFGPSYELARYSATGLHEPPLAEERMDQNLAGYAELKLSVGSGADDEMNASATAAVEHFTIGRTDTDFTLGLRFPGGKTLATARVIVVGIGAQPRYSAHAELRQRILDWLYVWGAGGTVHFPQADGSLVHGYTAGAGAGVDFSR